MQPSTDTWDAAVSRPIRDAVKGLRQCAAWLRQTPPHPDPPLVWRELAKAAAWIAARLQQRHVQPRTLLDDVVGYMDALHTIMERAAGTPFATVVTETLDVFLPPFLDAVETAVLAQHACVEADRGYELYAIMREHQRYLGSDAMAARAAFACGVVGTTEANAGAGAGAGQRSVWVVYMMQPHAAGVDIGVRGLWSAAIHVGVASSNATVRWRTDNAAQPSVPPAVWDLALAIARTEVARLDAPCTCPASDPQVVPFAAHADAVACACYGGLKSAATRHRVHSTACPFTGRPGGLDEHWWTWPTVMAAAERLGPMPRGVLLDACRSFLHAPRLLTWLPCPGRPTKDGANMPHVPALIPPLRTTKAALHYAWHYDGDSACPSRWLCLYCGSHVAATASPLLVDTAWERFQKVAAKGK